MKTKTRYQAIEFQAPVVVVPKLARLGPSLASSLKVTNPLPVEQSEYFKSDFGFIKNSSYCHVLSLNEAELFDLEEVDECVSVMLNNSVITFASN